MRAEAAVTDNSLAKMPALLDNANARVANDVEVYEVLRMLVDRAASLDAYGANADDVLRDEHRRLFRSTAFRETLLSMVYTGYTNARKRRAHLVRQAEEADAAQVAYGKAVAFIESVVERGHFNEAESDHDAV